MTNFEKEKPRLESHNVSVFDIPKDIFEKIKGYVNNAKNEKNLITYTLAGHIKEEYDLFNQTIDKDVLDYLEDCTYAGPFYHNVLNKIDIMNGEGLPITLDSFWVNFQKKYEFNPMHNHSGIASFIIFVKIPYDLEEESKCYPDTNPSLPSYTSKLAFLNYNRDGTAVSLPTAVDKSFEGKLLMFDSKKYHQVYPFYTSDDYRITISGNFKFKT